jgi:hypothetical protein
VVPEARRALVVEERERRRAEFDDPRLEVSLAALFGGGARLGSRFRVGRRAGRRHRAQKVTEGV